MKLKVEIGGSELKPITFSNKEYKQKLAALQHVREHVQRWKNKLPRRLQLLTQKYTLFPIYHETEHEF